MEIVNFYQEFSLILSAMPIRYGKENGHIFVKLKKEETELVLSVTDDGIGIAEEEQEKIFRRFYQTDVSRGGEGSGLGLAMVYEIVKFYRGKSK